MTNNSPKIRRRTVLQAAAGLAIGQMAAGASRAASATNPTGGKIGDFDFLAGSWRISHRQLKTSGKNEWITFNGEATCWTILGGIGSVEELRIPTRKFSGMGLRLLDVEKRIWNDYWVSATNGLLTTPGQTGIFENGVGTFVADDIDGGKPIKVRGVWDRITPRSCRWYQAISRDGGQHWEENWFMDWVRG